jgi:hypothetical protein
MFNDFFGRDTEGKILKGFWIFLLSSMLLVSIGLLTASIFAVNAQDELPRVSPVPPIVTLENPPLTDAVPSTDFYQNPIVLLILALAIGGGIPATRWATQYAREFWADAGISLNSLQMRIIGLVCGVLVSSAFQMLGMYNAQELQVFPVWLQIIGLGLVFGVMAGGQHDSQRSRSEIVDSNSEFGDGDLTTAKHGKTEDYA